nr:1722_t:CDS:2 [Entrophospora candida]
MKYYYYREMIAAVPIQLLKSSIALNNFSINFLGVLRDKLSNGPHDTKLTFSPSRNDTDNSYINTVPALAQTPTPT